VGIDHDTAEFAVLMAVETRANLAVSAIGAGAG
jgi:hypothetical protein